MQSWIRGSSSILAILGGGMFLALPVAFLNGTVSILYPPPSPLTCQYCHIVEIYRQNPVEMIPFWASLGVVSILLGLLALKLNLSRRSGIALGLAFSLGSMALLFWTATLQIMRTFIVTPAGFLLVPETSAVSMAVATILFSYQLVRTGSSNMANGNKRFPLT